MIFTRKKESTMEDNPKSTSIRLTPRDRARLKTIAALKGMTMGQVISEILRKEYAAQIADGEIAL